MSILIYPPNDLPRSRRLGTLPDTCVPTNHFTTWDTRDILHVLSKSYEGGKCVPDSHKEHMRPISRACWHQKMTPSIMGEGDALESGGTGGRRDSHSSKKTRRLWTQGKLGFRPGPATMLQQIFFVIPPTEGNFGIEAFSVAAAHHPREFAAVPRPVLLLQRLHQVLHRQEAGNVRHL